MSAPSSWQESNGRQLAAKVAELRDRLTRFAQRPGPGASTMANGPGQPDVAPPSVEDDIKAKPPGQNATPSQSLVDRLVNRWRTRTPLQLPPPEAPASTEPLSAVEETTAAADIPSQPAELPSALDILSERLGLLPFEKNVLLLCAAMELDTRIAGLCARAQDDPHKPFPTFALALALFDDPSWDALSPERPLRYWRLLEIDQPGGRPLTASALRADERIVNYLKGLNHLDDRASTLLMPLETETGADMLSASQESVATTVVHRWMQAAEMGSLPVMQLLGPDALSKQLVAQSAARALGRRLYRMPIELLPTSSQDLETLARLWQRESRLLPLALLLDAEDVDSTVAERAGSLSRFLVRSDGVFFVSAREALPRLGCSTVALDVTKPTADEQHAAWIDTLGADGRETAAALVAQFNFNLPQIRRAVEQARAQAEEAQTSLSEATWSVCRDGERPRLAALAQRLEPKATWDDLVLPAAEMSLLRQIAAQARLRNTVYVAWGFERKMNRGFGIAALFAGDSGTGKTMAAEVIANDLRLNLYRIDLSAVVNKYIGETEKNLRRLFDAADDTGAILFFDEADALFGKRSEVRDSHDRYANIEINYLLQRIESYRGLAILATNLKTALDTAFLRRLRFVVNFPFPAAAERRRLWEKVFLQKDAAEGRPSPPLERLDYDRLARLNLAGGHIHSVALNAAFRAAEAGVKVSMPLVLAAARAEFMKLERPINESDFRWAEPIRPAGVPAHAEKEAVLP
jgi:hypothetical protein